MTNVAFGVAGEFYFYGKALNFKAAMPADLEVIDIANAAQPVSAK